MPSGKGLKKCEVFHRCHDMNMVNSKDRNMVLSQAMWDFFNTLPRAQHCWACCADINGGGPVQKPDCRRPDEVAQRIIDRLDTILELRRCGTSLTVSINLYASNYSKM
ncbi:hypothetical protein A2U01_0011137 [Trifolium medium]|uniref:Uncharacterized protein n=1 Tax=Trifolium medium TaxID=97028 RepID=A0A392MRN2_9FABA|nr:hypothetical protein [Trifolium medium]